MCYTEWGDTLRSVCVHRMVGETLRSVCVYRMGVEKDPEGRVQLRVRVRVVSSQHRIH